MARKDIVPAPGSGSLSTDMAAELRDVLEDAASIIDDAVPVNTKRAYESDWEAFTTWCARFGMTPRPADPRVVVAYLTALAQGKRFEGDKAHKASTVARHMATISTMHRQADLPSPTATEVVRKLLRGLRKRMGPVDKKDPALSEHLAAMVAAMPPGLAGLRNTAILLVGFSGAFRRSEIAGIRFEDLTWVEQGVVVHLSHSKTDKESLGQDVRVPYGTPPTCPVRALASWCDAMAEAGITSGPVFRDVRPGHPHEPISNALVAKIVKAAADRIGLDPAKFAGHSLRAGHVTSAAMDGKDLHHIRDKTRHKSLDMLAEYIRLVGSWDDDSSKGML